jgi:hypothetical protein
LSITTCPQAGVAIVTVTVDPMVTDDGDLVTPVVSVACGLGRGEPLPVGDEQRLDNQVTRLLRHWRFGERLLGAGQRALLAQPARIAQVSVATRAATRKSG